MVLHKFKPRSMRYKAALIAFLLGVGSLLALSTNTRSVQATTLPVVQKSGTLSANETWVSGNVYLITGSLTVPNGVTLTIDPGVIVKHNGPGWQDKSIIVATGGTLDVNGVSGNPVHFTSYRDDSLGGDSNGDGASAGANGDYNAAVTAVGGTVSIEYSTIQFGGSVLIASSNGCQGSSNMVTLTDNIFESKLVLWDCKEGSMTLLRNQFTVPAGQYPVETHAIDASIIRLTGTDKNTFSGSGTQVTLPLNDVGVRVPANTSWTVDPTSGLEVLYIQNQFEVAGTLTINPGVIIKHNGPGWQNRAIVVPSGGNLDVNGTTNSPVIFTSYRDDSIGGDSNGDGSSAATSGDYYASVLATGGVVDVEHSEFLFGSLSVSAGQSGCQGGQDMLSLTDNVFESKLVLWDCKENSTTLLRNHFAVPVNNYPLETHAIDVNIIRLTGTDKNTFAGQGMQTALTLSDVGTKVPSGASWTVDPASGIDALYLQHQLEVVGTLTINPGAVVKYSGPGWQSRPILVSSGGVLDVNGTTNDPVVFTSYRDDSVGGDSNADGSSSGGNGDYANAFTISNGSAAIEHAIMRFGNTGVNMYGTGELVIDDTQLDGYQAFYIDDGEVLANNVEINNLGSGTSVTVFSGLVNFANTSITGGSVGLDVKNDAEVAFRGSFDSVTDKAIKSCKWGQNCAVDVAHVDWGSADGPLPSGDDPLACGQVAVSPWVYNATTYDGEIFTSQNCDNSASPYDGLANGISYFQQRISTKQIDCGNGFQDACNAINTAMSCLGGAMSVAQGQLSWPLPPATTQQEIAAFGGLVLDGASDYLTSSATVSVSGFSFGLITKLVGTAASIVSMAGAYNSCAP